MSRRPAFTLVEVLVAIALVLALVATMYGFLFDLLSARRRVIDHVWQETAASALVKQLDADLSTCIVGDSVYGSGVQGDGKQVRVLTRSIAAHLAGRGADDPDVFGDLQLAEYRFDEGNRRIEGRRSPAVRLGTTPPPFAPLEGAVHRVRFRYHDGAQWRRSFDSRASNRLPLAIEVSIWYSGDLEEHEPKATSAPSDESSAEQPDSAASEAENVNSLEQVETEERPVEDEASLSSPDRVRIIVIPDAGQVESETTEESDV